MVRSYLPLNAMHSRITLATFLGAKRCCLRVFIGKPSSAQLQEGSLAPGVETKICFPFLTSRSWISWKGWQKPFDLQGGCQLSMTRFQRSTEEPCMWLWSVFSRTGCLWQESEGNQHLKNTLSYQVYTAKCNSQEPSVSSKEYMINVWIGIWRFWQIFRIYHHLNFSNIAYYLSCMALFV